MSQENVEVVQALIPPPDTDVASLLRDDSLFEQTRAALEPLIDPAVESVAVWQGGGATTYIGIDGFRKLWLDWLEPWATYHVRVDEVIDAGDRIVVLSHRPGTISTILTNDAPRPRTQNDPTVLEQIRKANEILKAEVTWADQHLL